MNYELRTYTLQDGDSIDIDDNAIICGTVPDAYGTKLRVLEPTEGDATKQTDEKPRCGYEGCQRTVSDPEDTCWQHSSE